MGCLFVIIAALSPRAGIIILWLFTDYVNRAFSTWFWPLLGLVLLPWTTLMFILVEAPVGNITFWGWLMLGLGVIIDLSNYAQSYEHRQQAAALYRPS